MQVRANKRHRAVPLSNLILLKELFIGLVVDTDSPLSLLDNHFFKRIYQILDHREGLYDHLCFSHSSARRALNTMFDSKRAFVKTHVLGTACSRINISFDMWTSPNGQAYIAIVAHFLARSYRHLNILLSIKRHKGAHNGEKISSSIIPVLDEWGIISQIGATISDNASANNTCVDAIIRSVRPDIASHERGFFRLRCYGHILNLVAKAFLFGADDEALLSELEKRDLNKDLSAEERDILDRWRRTGPVGKLQNIVKFIRASPQRRELLQKIGRMHTDPDGDTVDVLAEEYMKDADLGLVLNNQTRWNSTYLMIERGIRKKHHIDQFISFCETTPAYDAVPSEWHLTADNWRLLVEIREILEPIFEQTKRCEGWGSEGHHGSLWEILGSMEYLLSYFEKVKEEYSAVTNSLKVA